jgi:DNA-binding FadR family transcriptional regulator
MASLELTSGSRRVLRPQRFGDVVAEELIRSLARGDFQPGDRLPAEPQLQTDFGVSRTVLREALKFVESRGMISIRQGRGAVVRPTESWNLLDPLVLSATLESHPTPEVFEHLMAVRALLEPELTRSAAGRIGDEDLDLLAELLGRMAGEVAESEQYLLDDVAFHAVINRNADNLVARSILTSIEMPLRIGRRLTNTIPDALVKAQQEHQRIFELLRARDGDAAAEAMQRHLSRSRDQLLQRWSSEPPKRSSRFADR